jgi:hypothetical protein
MFNERIFYTNFFGRGGFDHYGNIKWGISPIFNWAAPGVGKSEKARMLGKKYNCDYVKSINLANQSPATIGGAMFPNPEKGYFERLPPKWVYEANEAKRALIIFDEFGDAPALMQALAQDVLNERQVGDTHLKGHVRTMCFGNPPNMSTNPVETGLATANRGAHFDLSFQLQHQRDWCRWMMEDGGEIFEPEKVDADAEEKRVSARFAEDYAFARGVTVSFVRSVQKLLVVPPEGSKQRGRAWCSPRTMTLMTRWLAACRAHDVDETDRDAGIQAYIGTSMTKEFARWRNEVNFPSAEDILDGKINFKHDTTRPDITLFVLNNGAMLVRGVAENRKQRCKRLFEIMRDVTEDEADLVYMAAETVQPVPYKDSNRRWVMQNLFDADEIIRNA